MEDKYDPLPQSVALALRDVASALQHDELTRLLQYKLELLLQDAASLAGHAYSTTDQREAVFLIRQLFVSDHFGAVATALRTDAPQGPLALNGPLQDALVSAMADAASAGKPISALVCVSDWLSMMSDDTSIAAMHRLLASGVKVKVVPTSAVAAFPNGGVSVFTSGSGERAIIRFLYGNDRQHILPFTVSYDPTDAVASGTLLNSLWTVSQSRTANLA